MSYNLPVVNANKIKKFIEKIDKEENGTTKWVTLNDEIKTEFIGIKDASIGSLPHEQYGHINDGKTWVDSVKTAEKTLDPIRLVKHNNKNNTGFISDFLTQVSAPAFIQAMLPHTGIHVVLEHIDQYSLIMARKRLLEDEMVANESMVGSVNSNLRISNIKAFKSVFGNNIKTTSLTGIKVSDLFNVIKLEDLNILLNAIVTSIYPDGFKNTLTCNQFVEGDNNENICRNTIETNIDPSKLVFINESKLTDTAKSILVNRGVNSQTMDDIKRYQNEIEKTNDTIILDINGVKLNIKLHSPTINQYISAGEFQNKRIKKLVDKMLKDNNNKSERSALVDELKKTSRPLHYLHYVKSITYTKPDGTIMSTNVDDNITDVADVLKYISGNIVSTNEFIAGINEFIKSSTLAVVGIPEWSCESCTGINGGTYHGIEHFVPLDMLAVFFGITRREIERTMDR